ncbi:adoMet-dependent rRNA methyltransferase spb1-like [Humulus lupulus]|uniref:adoMet-dependent rRNA methyltransferase spb1-like n=1 Tax=Humulus lupulus TaxID=3486 RepID=UPI002B405FC5|nr:adoMet-dependent rRNA methyltransferase spb1-like [Humulus lupulus]XP_062073904.1 adoMet-dependent rRNA methyltransferase spb1-like [Humulus lupulus]
MGKENQKRKSDIYTKLTNESGFRSRAAWKLIQLDNKFGLFRNKCAVLDLCAAPGGWTQVATQRVPCGSLLMGVDLVWIKPMPRAIFIQQDITKPECKSQIKRVMSKYNCSAFDLVLHNGAPNMGGAWAMEATVQNALVIDAVKLATHLLAPKGTFVTKVFRSQDYHSVKYCLSKLFERVVVHKPNASRSSSAEIFVLAFKYKAAAKIDPRILDVRHLFQGAIEPQKKKVSHDLGGVGRKRHRDGYEDGDTTLRKVSAAAEFIWSDAPLDILGSVTSICFDDPTSLPIKDHALTTEEVQTLCDDLGVLGKQDFKYLLKWQIHIRKTLIHSQKADVTAVTNVENEEKEDEDDKIVNEMEELTHAMECKKARVKKLLAKRQAKEKAQKEMGMQMEGVDDSYVDHELFSLSTIKGKNALVVVDSTELDDDTNSNLGDSENEESHDGSEHGNLDSDEERKRYDEQIEALLEQAYEQYISKKNDNSKQQHKPPKRLCYKDVQILESFDDDDDEIIHPDYDFDGDQEMNPLMVSLDVGKGSTQEEITNKWFSQDIFCEAANDERDAAGKFDSEDEMKEKISVQVNKAQTKTENSDDFEIVPAPGSVFESDDEDDDVDAKAETLSSAKNMLKKKQRNEILDDAYNKYMMFGDEEGVPKWFLDEEKRHCHPIKPVTKEEVNAMKTRFKEIDARPVKKVVEAKARKKRVAMKKLEKARKMANAISEQTDISNISKNKMIDKLYKKAIPKRPKKEYVVAKKSVQVKVGKGKTLVDRRMKKDLRAATCRKSKMAKGTSKMGKRA